MASNIKSLPQSHLCVRRWNRRSTRTVTRRHWVLIAFCTRKLSSAERNYIAFGQRTTCSLCRHQHFRHFVEAKLFTVYTYHKPLTFAFASSADRSPRQSGHHSYMQGYHRFGLKNKDNQKTTFLCIHFFYFQY